LIAPCRQTAPTVIPDSGREGFAPDFSRDALKLFRAFFATEEVFLVLDFYADGFRFWDVGMAVRVFYHVRRPKFGFLLTGRRSEHGPDGKDHNDYKDYDGSETEHALILCLSGPKFNV